MKRTIIFLILAVFFCAQPLLAQSDSTDVATIDSRGDTDGNDTKGGGGTLYPPVPSDSIDDPITPGWPDTPIDTTIIHPFNPHAIPFYGALSGQFAVSATGGATYSVPIEVPPGIGGTQPQVSIVYNSQSGLGNVGWGCNVAASSSITRGMKDIFHDGTAKGMTYAADDAYYLDGRRLILAEGTEGAVGCVYHPEGDPFTDATVRQGQYGTYFEVKSPDGMTAIYGDDYNSRTLFWSGGTLYASAWHLKMLTDTKGHTLYYQYANSDLFHCVSKISYYIGNGSVCTINFTYTSLGDAAQPFRLMDAEGKIDKRLTQITCKEGSITLRTYSFTYNTTSDGTAVKFPRLTAINVKDGNENALQPISFEWNSNPCFSIDSQEHELSQNIIPLSAPSDTHFTNNYFYGGDTNGDGVDDIVQISECYSSSQGKTAYVTFHQTLGPNTYFTWPCGTPIDINMSEFYPLFTWIRSEMFADLDGNGAKDLIIATYKIIDNTGKVYIRPFYGNKGNYAQPTRSDSLCISIVKKGSTPPLYCISDVNNDGINEVLILEVDKQSSQLGYVIHLISGSEDRTNSVHMFHLPLPATPRRLLSSDFNGDGMQDLLVITDNEYVVYWNRGSYPSALFPFGKGPGETGTFTTTGTTISNVQDIQPGDFNGDGLPDLILHSNDTSIYTIALNNGDGTFSQYTSDTGLGDQNAPDDDDKFTLLVNDFDNDGKSDLLIGHAYYQFHGGLSQSYEYKHTDIKWYRSTGTALSLLKSVRTKNESDTRNGHITLADVNGDGYKELVNLGARISADVTSSMDERIRFNYTQLSPIAGKIKAVTDGLGNTPRISYTTLTEPSVYTKGTGAVFPVLDVQAPLHVVSSVQTPTASSTDFTSVQTETYRYEGLKAHVQGRGLLGFARTTINNNLQGITTVKETRGWRRGNFYTPTYSSQAIFLDDSTFQEKTDSLAFSIDATGKNYYLFPSEENIVDFDGLVKHTEYLYDRDKGILTTRKEWYDAGESAMYRETVYDEFTQIGKQWLPQMVITRQKHKHDANEFVSQKFVHYNDVALPDSVIDNYGSSLPLTTTNTYDGYGNLTSQTKAGAGINTVTTHYQYDATRRFVAQATTTPSSVVTTRTYDAWGNVLTESDATDPANILTTTNTYDGFGNLQQSVSPEGIVTTVETQWGSSKAKRYGTLRQTQGQPWKTTWYDCHGHEVESGTIGPMDVSITATASYDERGNIISKTSTQGDLSSWETMEYDQRNRLVRDELSTGSVTAYSYAPRQVVTTVNGRQYTKTYDEWGNLLRSEEPVGMVSYSYKSCGKPSAAGGSSGGTVIMAYDDCGNQIRLVDPDAGTTTYGYNALGEVITQTDARGITTTHGYDSLNRVTQTTTGTNVVSYTYGASGNASHRLLSQTSGDYGISYTYDSFGHVLTETRCFGSTQYVFTYQYDSLGRISSVTYPQDVVVSYAYDDYGNETQMQVGGNTVWQLTAFDGLNTAEQLGTGTTAMTRSTTRDGHGLLSGLYLRRASNNTTLHQMTFQHDPLTGNLTSRTGMYSYGEDFTYDNIDRLVRHQDSSHHLDNIVQYTTDGNIQYKTDIGGYGYQPTSGIKPHAVKDSWNTSGKISTDGQTIAYNDFGKASYLNENHAGRHYYLYYGPDQERWKSEYYTSGHSWPDTIRYYIGNMEALQTGPGISEYDYYLDHGVYLRKVGTQLLTYYLFTDNLGSVTRIIRSNGATVFSAQYDPWGVQTVTTNTIAFSRGYCGHEMLNGFQLINMNGRLYDPYLGRFLSPDNYVQLPTSAQSFNRYSYCLNNPLKYVDPDGEFAILGFNILANTVRNFLRHGFNISQYSYKQVKQDLKIIGGMFNGNFLQILNKWTWGMHTSIIGLQIGRYANALGMVDGVTYLDGGVAIGSVTTGSKAFTIGQYSFGPKHYKASWQDNLFVHEYGHYIQSQILGDFYIPIVALPSLGSAIGLGKPEHKSRWFEVWASRLGAYHFENRYGIGSEYYKQMKGSYPERNVDFFDLNVFTNRRFHSYFNPRTGEYRQDKNFPIHGSRKSFWDYILPLHPEIILSYFPYYLLKNLK